MVFIVWYHVCVCYLHKFVKFAEKCKQFQESVLEYLGTDDNISAELTGCSVNSCAGAGVT
jgi:hypothetical protein